MKLSEEVKQAIRDEFNDFKAKMYAHKSLEERKSLDQFFTPPELTIALIEKFSFTNEEFAEQVILDPCCGSGNLLMGCLIAGVPLDNLYGNEYDKEMVKVCKDRFRDYLHRPEHADLLAQIKDERNKYSLHFHRGNALQALCLREFNDRYNSEYKPDAPTRWDENGNPTMFAIDDPNYAQGNKPKNNWYTVPEKPMVQMRMDEVDQW